MHVAEQQTDEYQVEMIIPELGYSVSAEELINFTLRKAVLKTSGGWSHVHSGFICLVLVFIIVKNKNNN